MRSDWDPDHRKKPNRQKRYPDITESEWRFLLQVIRGGGLGLAGETGRQMGERLGRLQRKIEARLADETPRRGERG